MRKTVSAVLLAACVFGGVVTATPVSARPCGGGAPGEPCYCPPPSIKVGKIEIPTGINC